MKKYPVGFMILVLAAVVAACSGGMQNSGDINADATPMTLRGVVHGGQAPIVGSAVTLRAASQQGLSDAAIVATAISDSNGNFNFSFTCPSPTAQMYLTSTGGNPGGGANSAIHLMSILGPCQSMHGSATVNELTTVAAAYTVNNFIRPSGCDDCSGGLPASVDNITGPAPGMPNAMGNAALLVNSITGLDAFTLPTSAECPASGTVPANCLTAKKLNTAANALAACVNSAGPTSAQCVQLFDCATVGTAFTSGTACTPPSGATLPTDTLQAMLNIVRNPATISVPGIDDTASRDVVFSPSASVHFNDYTLSLNLTAGGSNVPNSVAADGAGNIWVTSYGSKSVVKLAPNGTPLSGLVGFSISQNPVGIAFDAGGDAWVGADTASLTVLTPAGTPALGSPFTNGGLSYPYGIAVSPDGDVWVVDNGTFELSRFTASGSAVGSGYALGNSPTSIAVDAAGYVFVTNGGESGAAGIPSVSEFSPAGVLVNTITDNAIDGPLGVGLDVSGNLWLANYGLNSLVKVTLAGEGVVSVANFTGGGMNGPTGIATDASGNVWVGNEFGSGISAFNSAGTALSPSSGFIGAGINGAGITPAIDPSGNVWFANPRGSGVTVFFGVAAPTRTPLISALTQGFAP